MDRKTVSIRQACELVGVARRTIYNWIKDDKLEYIRTAGGSVRIFEDTLWRSPDGSLDPGIEKNPVSIQRRRRRTNLRSVPSRR